MKREILRSMIMACVTLGGTMADAMAEPLDVKTGFWELTIKSETQGAMPISQEDLQMLPPQLRSAMEKVMAPHTGVKKQCLTEQQLDKSENAFHMSVPGMSCNDMVTTHTRTTLAGTLECTKGILREAGDFVYEAKDPEHVVGKMNMASKDGTNTMSVKGTLSGRWLSASCDASK